MWMNQIFAVGNGDGTVRIYDARQSVKYANDFIAHQGKTNSVNFFQDDRRMLSAGRDNTVKIWDLRKINKVKEKFIPISEYNQHKCKNYNINANLIGEEKYILTGSEENKIFIYNILNGKIQTTIPTASKTTHLVKSFPVPFNQFSFLSSGISSNIVTLYGPYTSEQTQQKQQQQQENNQLNSFENISEKYLQVFEDVLQEYGDKILKIFHKNNFTYSQEMALESLFNLTVEDDEEEYILEQFEEKLFMKISQIAENKNNCEMNQQNQMKSQQYKLQQQQQVVKQMQVVINPKKSCKVCQYYKRLIAQKKV